MSENRPGATASYRAICDRWPRRCQLLMIMLLLSAGPRLFSQSKPKKVIRLPDALKEVSGLVYADPDSLWWHNDSGDTPSLYLTDGQGRIRRKVVLPVRNIDWEDLTADDRGSIFIGDFGNNKSQRRDLRIYRYEVHTGALDSISFRYPDQTDLEGPPDSRSFDVEAFFWYQDSLHLFSKSRLPKGSYISRHYVLSDQAGEQLAEFKDSILLKCRAVTAASIDPTNGRVGLLTYYYNRILGFWPVSKATVFFFEDYPEGRFLQGRRWRKKTSFLLAKQYESIDFVDDKYFYIASEQTLFIKARAKRLRIPRKHRKLLRP